MDELEPSPVPADRDLLPGDRPFTAWGQFGPGKLDMRVFDQDVWWVDVLGRPHRLVAMSDEYLTNVITFLTEGEQRFHQGTVLRGLLEDIGALLEGRPGGQQVLEATGAPALSEVEPRAWLEGSPLMRVLRRELAARRDRAPHDE